MDKRKLEEKLFQGLMIFSALTIISVLAFILAVIISRGLPAMNLAMLTQIPKGGYYLGKAGGILNAIMGSLYLAAGSTGLAILVSLPVVLYLNLYARKNSPLVCFTRFSLDVLWGVPSIVYGAFGFTLMLLLGLKASLLAGIITVALLILPIMSRAMDEVIRTVPDELLEASYALGATKLETGLNVVLRQTLPAMLTAVLLAFGRGIGDAASVLFTAGFTDRIPCSLLKPAATLPLAIFFQLGTPIPAVQKRAYASALILTVIILIVSLVSRMLSRRFARHILK
ncbi:MAG: phosphate ABC transporter permease PstA [Candidatus Omnitrophota bacterium]